MAHILIADDQEKIRPMLKSLLEPCGHEVTLAINGREALNQFRPDKIDLFITDILMPDMEGIETIRELSKGDADVKDHCHVRRGSNRSGGIFTCGR